MKRLVGPIAAFLFATAAGAQSRPASPASPGGPSVGDVVVNAQAPQAQTLIDRKVFTVSGDLQTISGSAADVLAKLPSVEVDADGNVSLRGDSHVTILVDGKPSAQFSGSSPGLGLLQFPASDIERIEILTTPPAQFKAEGAGGVINIITKRTVRPGVTGVARASVGEFGRYVLGVDGSYNVGRLKLSGGVALRQDIKERLTTSNRLETDPTSNQPVQSGERIDEHFHRLFPSVKLNLDYQLSDRQTIGASYSRRELSGARFFDQHDVSGPPGAAPASVSDRHSDGVEWNVDAGEGLHFDQRLWRPGETLTLAARRSETHERERYVYRNTFTQPLADPTFDDLHLSLDLVKTEVSADYDLPLAKDRELKLGYDLEDDANAFDNRGDSIDPATGALTLDPNVTNDFRYRQQVSAAYADFQAPIGPWRLDGGLRLEATRVATLQITGDIAGGRHDFGAYPSLHLDRSLGDGGKITLAIARRVTRPDPEALNPFADHQDTHNLRAGNPNLLPQDTWSFEGGYVGVLRSLTYGASVYYRSDRNSVTDVVEPVGAGVVLITKMNLPRSRSAGLEFSLNGKLGERLTYDLSGNLFYSQIDASALGSPGLASTTGLNVKASLDWRPTSADTLQLSFTRSDKRLTPQGYVKALNLVNLGYRRQVRPDLAVVATISDLFDGQKVERLALTTQLRDDYLRFQYGRIAYVGLVYTFGGHAKAKPASGFDYDQ
ncbi:MAG: TonB-dependent receptor domain-containing protein [Caulobacterales bacterium]